MMIARRLGIAVLLAMAGMSAAQADGPPQKSAPPPAAVTAASGAPGQSRAVFGVSVTVLDDDAAGSAPPAPQQAPGK